MIPAEHRKQVVAAVVDMLTEKFKDTDVSIYADLPQQLQLPAAIVRIDADLWEQESAQYQAELAVSLVVANAETNSFDEIFIGISEAFLANDTLGGTVDGTAYAAWAPSEEEFDDKAGLEITLWDVWKHTGPMPVI